MKKIFSALVLLNILVFLFLPVVATAQVPPESCTMKRTIVLKDFICSEGDLIKLDGERAICCLLNTIYNVTDWIFVFLVALATVFVILGAIFLLTAAGAPDRIASGRNYIIYAMVGLALGFVAKAIPAIVKLITGTT